MANFWIIGGILFIISIIIVSRLSLQYFKKQTSEKMRKQFGMNTRYYQLVVLVSFGITSFVLLLLKLTNTVSFN